MVLRVVMEKIQTLAIGCSKTSRGFTLIELLVSIIIIGLVSSIIFLNSSVLDSLEKNTGALKNLFNYLSEESMLSGSMIGFYAKNNKIDASYINNLGIKINNRKIDLPKTNWDDFKNYKKSYLSPEGIETVIKDEFDSSPLLIFFPDGQNSGGQIRVELDSNIYIIDIDKNGNFETKYETY